jgi:hypothetical protein
MTTGWWVYASTIGVTALAEAVWFIGVECRR